MPCGLLLLILFLFPLTLSYLYIILAYIANTIIYSIFEFKDLTLAVFIKEFTIPVLRAFEVITEEIAAVCFYQSAETMSHTVKDLTFIYELIVVKFPSDDNFIRL